MTQTASKSHDLYLGVDGGATKTHIVVMDASQNVLTEGFGGPSNPLRIGVDRAVANILEPVNSALDKIRRSPYDLSRAVVGLAGVRREDLRETVRSRLAGEIGRKYLEVVTDAEIALYATTKGGAGVVLIAGTGSICIGRDAKGKKAVAGGWGPIAGDEGGGISVAKDALHAVAKAMDGRGRPTKLCEVAAGYFRASTAEDLVVAIYSPLMDNRRLAGFAKCVADTAAEGDEIAVELMAVAGFELGLSAYAVIKRLKMQEKDVAVGTVGGMFKAGDLIKEPLVETLHSFAPKAFLKEPELSPAHAAAVLAMVNRKRRPSV